YRIHPYAVGTGSGTDCHYGTSRDTVVRIWVNPTPRISVVAVEDTLCNEGTTTITVSSLTGLTSGEVLFDYTIEDVNGDITGQTTGTGLPLGSITQTLTLTLHAALRIYYRIHPYAVGTGSGT